MLLAGCQDANLKPMPAAKQGVLDLRTWDFKQDGTVTVRGQWEFAWNELRESLDYREHKSSPEYIEVPGSWHKDGYPMPSQGYATYRLNIIHQPMNETLAIRVPTILTSYRMWLNGKVVQKVGEVGKSKQESEPSLVPKIVLLPADRPSSELVVEVSNYHHRRAGIWKPFEIGLSDTMLQRQYVNASKEMVIFGAILMMTVYHFGLYLLRRKEKVALFFALICLFIGLRMFAIGECFLVQWFPGVTWELSLKMEYIGMVLGPLFGYYYVSTMFADWDSKRLRRILNVLAAALTLSILFTPGIVYSKWLIIYQIHVVAIAFICIYILIRATVQRRPNALSALTGMVIFFVTVASDVLYYNEVWNIDDISQYGLLFFVLVQSIIITRIFTRVLREVEEVSSKLRELNANLEDRIQERTNELTDSNMNIVRKNKELERMELSRRQLLSNISHDLRTPITLIQGYLEALHDDVIEEPEQRKKTLKLMIQKVTGLNRLISDLFELSKLEARQVPIELVDTPVEELISFVEQGYELEVTNHNLQFACYDLLSESDASAPLIVRIDIDRMSQVFNNLIHNAIKHTLSGGRISIYFTYSPEKEQLEIEVADTGAGLEQEEIPLIFDRFYKKDKSRNSAGGGSGLGLAIAKEIVEAHQGEIWAQSKLGQGSHFFIALPVKII